MDCSLPGSSVHGIMQARILKWIAIFFSRGSSWPRNQTQVSCIAGRFFTNWATREESLCCLKLEGLDKEILDTILPLLKLQAHFRSWQWSPYMYVYTYVSIQCQLLSRVQLFLTLWTSLPGSSVNGILQARILEWVAISFSRESSQPRDRTRSPALQANSLPSEPPGKNASADSCKRHRFDL